MRSWIVLAALLLVAVPATEAQAAPPFRLEIESIGAEPVHGSQPFVVFVQFEVSCPSPSHYAQSPPLVGWDVIAPAGYTVEAPQDWPHAEARCSPTQTTLDHETMLTVTPTVMPTAYSAQVFTVIARGDGDGVSRGQSNDFEALFSIQPDVAGSFSLEAPRAATSGDDPVLVVDVENPSNAFIDLRPTILAGPFNTDQVDTVRIAPGHSGPVEFNWALDRDWRDGVLELEWDALLVTGEPMPGTEGLTTTTRIVNDDAPLLDVPGPAIIPALLAALALARRRAST